MIGTYLILEPRICERWLDSIQEAFKQRSTENSWYFPHFEYSTVLPILLSDYLLNCFLPQRPEGPYPEMIASNLSRIAACLKR
jgi:hypothetical protein